jgi:DNA-binding transcriptional MerR regulator
MSATESTGSGKAAEGEMTIRELAERTGMTVRNIRAHQTRGLLPPPVVRGRTGYYNEEHVARIALTREMQADGLNLEAIRRVLESGDGSATEIFDFTRALRAPFEEETPEIVEASELAGVWGTGGKPDPELMRRAEKLGILRALPDGRIEVISPRLERAAIAVAELGVGPEGALATAEKLRRHADGVARAFVELFVKEVWGPFDRAGRPEGEWPKVRESLDRMRPLASDALLAVFQIAMGEAVEKAGERTLRVAARKRPAGRARSSGSRGAQASGKGKRR